MTRLAIPLFLTLILALTGLPTKATAADTPTQETVVLAGGCFWGVQAVFQHLKGVTNAVSGYAGGDADSAHYETVSSGRTGHAEAVAITFDPSVVDYQTLLRVFFLVAHDPTELDRQGADVGPQYRSALFVGSATERQTAEAVLADLGRNGSFSRPPVTRIEPLAGFYPAEAYHQNFATLHPEHPYIRYTDRPKVEAFRQRFPDLYRAEPALVP